MSQAETRSIDEAERIASEVDTGGREPRGLTRSVILVLAFVWSLFQLYIASAVPFWLSEATGLNVVFNNQEARQIHLAFALVLAMLAYPLFRSSPRQHVPWYDWLLAAAGALSCLYLFVLREEIGRRAGLPTTADLAISTIGMISIAIAVFRSLGLPLVIVAGVFVLYVFFGHMSFLPEAIQWKGASFGKALWHFWMQTEGVFGVALGVSASMIFLFVLFGALLEKAGAGNYFIKLAFALLGHLRGGPAKAAVVASALSGVYSGSSIANVVTTGTFTIPLMKRTGFKAEKAGAVEVASSTNGQLMPPVMGAAAFLISEFTGVAYSELIKHAFLPAVISYIALVYIVHIEALKMGLKGLERPTPLGTLAARLSSVLFGFLAMMVLAVVVYYGLGWIKTAVPGLTLATVAILFLLAYLVCLWLAARHPDLEMDDPNAPLLALPRPWEVAVTGFHFVLPIVILLWCVLVERLSPTLSAYWAAMAMIFIVLTQHSLKRILRGEGGLAIGVRQGWSDFVSGMVAGARNMIGIGVATAVAGVIIGTVSLTGAHQVIGEFVEYLSGGSLMAMLLLVAVMSLVLGMGLPTTANYIVVSSLMAPVIVSLGAQSGLIVPLVAVHLFVFYFGILADDTPPVGLAAFAAAAISGGDPIRTGLQGFAYDIRTALLPFLFIFNTDLLLIDVTFLEGLVVFVVATVAMMVFAAATQGYFFARSRLWETLALLLVAFTLFRPGFWLDQIAAPFDARPGAEVVRLAGAAGAGESLRLVIEGPDFDRPDEQTTKTFIVALGAAGSGSERLAQAGLLVREEAGKALLDEPLPGSRYFQSLQGFDFYGDNPVEITRIETPAERMPRQVFYIPAFLLLLIVILAQRRRQTVPAF
ncbi:MAG: TRAP transporter fused permease subunit [Rhizobiales bacterium]|nr:TRAP transporter fused permease subunit [Hyphomicrobiales bacterium]